MEFLSQNKVLVETNVLVSASINRLIEDLDIKVEHKFYNISKPLFEYFKKNIEKRVGIFTSKIEQSSKDVLKKAIEDEIKSKEDVKNRKKLFNRLTSLYAESIRELNENMNLLSREPVNENEIAKNNQMVLIFYSKLKREIIKYDPVKKGSREANTVSKRFKKLAKRIYISQYKKDSLYNKLRNILVVSPPNLNDIEILSQAIYFKKVFSKDRKIKFFLASTDHHFSKIRKDKELNTFIPDKINETFGIICDWPNEILKKL